MIKFEHTESPKARHQDSNRNEGSGSNDEVDGNPAHRKDKFDKTTKDKGKDYERKPKKCYFCDSLHKVRRCLVRNKLATIVQAEEKSECDSSNNDRHQGEPRRLGAIQVQDEHHEEQPKRVMQLGAIRLCRESSRIEKEGTEIMAKGCHDAGVEAQPDSSRESTQCATQKKRRICRQCKTKGPTSEGTKRSHTKKSTQ